MLDRILIGSSAEPTDPNFKNVTLLLHGDGSNGAQNNTFIDSSTNNFTITRNGNTTQGSFSPYGSNWSNYFDGSGDFLSAASNAAFDLGGSSFTIECWFNANSFASGFGLVSRYNYTNQGFGWGLIVNSSTSIRFIRGNDILLDCTVSAMSTGVWYHFAVVRNGSTLTVYLNGTQVGQETGISNFSDATTALQIGRTNTVTNDINGYISNVRVVKGTAVYTSAFTPSTTPLTAITNTSLLTCADNRFRDGSTNNFTITRNGDVKVTNFAPFAPSVEYSTTTNGGSAYFDGSGDYLSGPVSSAFEFGTGDWTMECWVYVISAPSDSYIMDVTVSGGIQILMTLGSGNFYLLTNAGGGYSYTNFGAMPVGQWVHLAITRQSNVCYGYINGVKSGTSVSMSNNLTGSYYPGINAYGAKFNGYVSNARMVKGTAVYTANFTPTTTPLTAISGTSLLLNATNAAIFDNSMKNDLETVGNAQISTSVKKFGTGSMYFDGSGDWLDSQSTSEIAIGGGDFTIEAWIYPTGVSGTDSVIFDFRNGNPSNNGPLMIIGAGSGNPLVYVAAGSARITGSGITLNTWSHVAVSRSGTSTKMFLNGTQTGSTYTDTNNYASPVRIRIGADDDGGANAYFIGYMDEFRVTKGVARYTANFTPPTAPFPNK